MELLGGKYGGVINAKDVRKSDVVRLVPQFLATTWPFKVKLKKGQ